jgi:hypothetical protein
MTSTIQVGVPLAPGPFPAIGIAIFYNQLNKNILIQSTRECGSRRIRYGDTV